MSTEQIELRADGTIVAVFGEATYTLRRPNLGEYEDRRISASALWEGLEDLDSTTKIKEFSERAVPWWRTTFDMLGTALPADEREWPAWLVWHAGLIGEVLVHWRDAPLVRGGKA